MSAAELETLMGQADQQFEEPSPVNAGANANPLQHDDPPQGDDAKNNNPLGNFLVDNMLNPLQQAGSPENHNNPLDGDDPMDVDGGGGGISAENDRLQQQLGFVGQPSPPSGAPASSKIATILEEVSGSEKKLAGLKVKTKFAVFCSAV